MSIFKKLSKLNLPADSMVSLSYEEGVDVFVHNETEVDTALSETDVVSTVAELLATPKLKVYSSWGSEVLQEIRDHELLDDYERGSFGFSDYLTETITDNFYDIEVVEHSTEKYDHKRGFCTLSANVKVSMEDLIATGPCLGAWTVQVQTENGTLTLD